MNALLVAALALAFQLSPIQVPNLVIPPSFDLRGFTLTDSGSINQEYAAPTLVLTSNHTPAVNVEFKAPVDGHATILEVIFVKGKPYGFALAEGDIHAGKIERSEAELIPQSDFPPEAQPFLKPGRIDIEVIVTPEGSDDPTVKPLFSTVYEFNAAAPNAALQAVPVAVAPPVDYAPQALAEMQTIAHTITPRPPSTLKLATFAGDVAAIGVDTARTSACLAHEGRELDPIARPFVHSPAGMALGTGLAVAAAWFLPDNNFGNAIRAAFIGGEAANLTRHWGC